MTQSRFNLKQRRYAGAAQPTAPAWHSAMAGPVPAAEGPGRNLAKNPVSAGFPARRCAGARRQIPNAD